MEELQRILVFANLAQRRRKSKGIGDQLCQFRQLIAQQVTQNDSGTLNQRLFQQPGDISQRRNSFREEKALFTTQPLLDSLSKVDLF